MMARVRLPVDRIGQLAQDAAFIETVEALYEQLDRRIAARSPVCVNRELCCKFDAYGHQLFVTPVELAYFAARTAPPAEATGACPYQRGGLCTVRVARPTGCRIFFCEPGSRSWQPDETECTLRRLKRVHARFDLPYAYVEWLDALRQLSGTWPGRTRRSFDRRRRGS